WTRAPSRRRRLPRPPTRNRTEQSFDGVPSELQSRNDPIRNKLQQSLIAIVILLAPIALAWIWWKGGKAATQSVPTNQVSTSNQPRPKIIAVDIPPRTPAPVPVPAVQALPSLPAPEPKPPPAPEIAVSSSSGLSPRTE